MGVGTVRIASLEIRAAPSRGASDLHFGAATVRARRCGRLVGLETTPTTKAAARAFLLRNALRRAAGAPLRGRHADGGAPPAADGAPFRVHAYRSCRWSAVGNSAARRARAQPGRRAAGQSQVRRTAGGARIFTGPTGAAAKTTALAALVEASIVRPTQHRDRRGPVEYVHAPLRSFVTQCEVGATWPRLRRHCAASCAPIPT